MAVKVLITRHLKEGKIQDAYALLGELRGEALKYSGYISGETLIGYQDPRTLVVAATWDSLDSWRKWRDAPQRQGIDKKMQALLTEPAKYEEFLLGAYLPR